MNLRIKKKSLITFLYIFPFLEPWWLTKLGLVDNIFNLLKLMVCFVVILQILKNKYFISKIALLYASYRVYIVLVSIYRDMMPMGYITESIQFICFFILLENLIKEDGVEIIKYIIICLFLILLFNIITYTPTGIIFDQGSATYLIGVRTRIDDILIPAIALSLYYFKTTKKNRLLMLGSIITAILFVIFQWVATALFALCFFAILLIIDKFVQRKYDFLYNKIVIAFVTISSLGVVLFNIQYYFADFISLVLHKSVTLTGRTDIWAIALTKIKEHLWIGYGYSNQGDYISLYDFTTTSHNQWLQTMFYGGIIGCILFYSIVIISIYRVCKKDIEINKNRIIFLAGLATIIVMCTTEICMDNIYFLTFIICMSNCKKLNLRNTDMREI